MKFSSLLLLAGGALCAAGSATAASPARLFEIYAVRFIRDDTNAVILEQGRLTAEGEFKHYLFSQLGAGTNVPAEAFNRNLLPYVVFPAYDVFGPDALANFHFGSTVTVGSAFYFVVSTVDHPKLDIGTVPNLSARGVVSPTGEPLVGGFVVQDHSRRVLLRGVGPTLTDFGVTAPLANPVITVFRQGEHTGFASNDDWGQQANADDVAAAGTGVGAFALPRTSRDAAMLIELPPGAYTAQVTSADASGGSALLEIYLLP